MKRLLAALAIPLLLVAGCTATEKEPTETRTARAERPSPFADCAALTSPLPGPPPPGATADPSAPARRPAGPAPTRQPAEPTATAPAEPTAGQRPAGRASGPAPVGEPLPDLNFPCFTGGTPISLRKVTGPAVINVWASWCPPCRKELPAFQRLSERTEGRLRVVGVNSRDSRGGAQSIGEDFGVRFPMLADSGDALQRELGRNAIPLTVLVGADGRIRHVDASGALDDARLAELVRTHLGIAVDA
ncbi:TlpA family protein disulfide reductase [Micromonospora mirobrigensis]|uniref:Thiol-disulfide isomerase or thioredoxin n=1 Tax=Micromonospora mirobrigensis TaxID=262898 RepID=A0A1C4ZNN4_9ACTN|nr:TlpA disulfide reductase family protein [Micromonospora mirobrigensis]SCF34697.1 Thiol-disulfide isomerase or thioredoxin [Micromonospora mirobrigensis]